MQPVPKITEADVERLVRRDFPAEQVQQVLNMLREYGVEGWHREPERVRAGVLKLAKGKLKDVRHYVDEAKMDYRDILAWGEYPRYFKDVPPCGDGMEKKAVQKIVAEDWTEYQDWLNKK